MGKHTVIWALLLLSILPTAQATPPADHAECVDALETAGQLLESLCGSWLHAEECGQWIASGGDPRHFPIEALGVSGPVLIEALSLLPWKEGTLPSAKTPGWIELLRSLQKNAQQREQIKQDRLEVQPKVVELEVPPAFALNQEVITSISWAQDRSLLLSGLAPWREEGIPQVWTAQLPAHLEQLPESQRAQAWSATYRTRVLPLHTWDRWKKNLARLPNPVVRAIARAPDGTHGWAAALRGHRNSNFRLQIFDDSNQTHLFAKAPSNVRSVDGLQFSSDGETLYLLYQLEDRNRINSYIAGYSRRTGQLLFNSRSIENFGIPAIFPEIQPTGGAIDNSIVVKIIENGSHSSSTLYRLTPDGQLHALVGPTMTRLFSDSTTPRALSADRQFLAESSETLLVRATDPQLAAANARFPVPEGRVASLSFSPDRAYLAALTHAGEIMIYDWQKGIRLLVHRLISAKEEIYTKNEPHPSHHLIWGNLFPSAEGGRTLWVFSSSRPVVGLSGMRDRAWHITLPASLAP